MSTEQEKCRLIATFEGTARPWKMTLSGTTESGVNTPDYPHDLNATMRAARRLPANVWFVIEVSENKVAVWCGHAGERRTFSEWIGNSNVARAAFEALSAYLEKTITPMA